jgi:hypothetical protein
MALNIFEAPEYYQGLLGEDATKKLQNRALTTGLINAAIGYIAQPKTMGYGSALPYLGRALAGGLQAGQETIRSGLTDFENQQKIAEMKRKQEQQQALQGMIGGITDPNERLFAQLAPEQYVASKVKPKERKVEKVGRQLVDVTGATPTVLFTGEADEKAVASTELNKLLTERANLAQANPNDPNLKFYDDAIKKQTSKSEGINISYGAPQAGVDAQGNPVFFQPSKVGGLPQIVPGVAPLREEKPATESQAKAAAFGSQMQSASREFDQIQKEGFAPGATASQAQVEIAGTPLRAFADPLAQRAQQSQAQWSEAYLRYKTGAAATEGEVKRNINTFFPKIGETDPKVIEQKARMRKQAEEDVMKSAKQPSSIRQTQQQAQPRSKADILKQYGL